MELEDVLRECFPHDHTDLLKMAEIRKGSDASVRDMGVDDPTGILESVGRDHKALRRMCTALCGDSPLAMDYFGPFGETPGYLVLNEYLEYDCRRRSDIFVITDGDGVPSGVVPVVEGDDDHLIWSPYGSISGMDCTAITDRTYYTKELVRGLEKNVEDYLLVQVPFPISYSSTRNAQMQDLRHNGRDLKACKTRYDKRWLFRFTDPEEAEAVRRRIPEMNPRREEIEILNLSAGSTDVISNVGHDIRDVRRLLDLRERMDSEMRRHRRLLGNDADILRTDDSVTGYMLMSVISTRLSFTEHR